MALLAVLSLIVSSLILITIPFHGENSWFTMSLVATAVLLILTAISSF